MKKRLLSFSSVLVRKGHTKGEKTFLLSITDLIVMAYVYSAYVYSFIFGKQFMPMDPESILGTMGVRW